MNHVHRVSWRVIALAAVFAARSISAAAPVPVVLGQSVVNLNGPWKFHLGDDPAWADSRFDDSPWESVDLTAPPGAHDDDVGLTGYVPGWGSRGHRGYSGYAWYRLRVAISAPNESLALSGPPAVDSAYQVFINGRLLGGCGRFDGPIPTVFSVQPRLFAIPRALLHQDNTALIAFRVWMGPWDLGDPGAGGIHIAPALGDAGSTDLRYQLQWVQTLRGYIVEVVEAAAFLLLAVMAATLLAFDRARPSYIWLCAALVLLALYRANQAVFFWGQFETVHAFEAISVVLLIPAYMGAWVLAWRGWFRLREPRSIPAVVGAATIAYMGAQFFMRSSFHGVFPHWMGVSFHCAATVARLLLLLLNVCVIYWAIRANPREAWLALPGIALLSIGLFAQELSSLGVRGIWFPFGTGVSRTQYAYAAFDAVLFAMLLRRLLLFARPT